MNQTWPREKLSEVQAELFRRAAMDPVFRQLCLSDPAAAIKAISGLDLPAGTRLRLVEKREEVVWVLPPLGQAVELSDRELESVAGGGFPSTQNPHDAFCSNLQGRCGL